MSGRRDEPEPEDEARSRALWHADRAARMEEGLEPRLYHLLRAGKLKLAQEEAAGAARRHLEGGSPACALSLLVETVRALIDSPEQARIPGLLELGLQAALALGTTNALDRVVFLVQRSGLNVKETRAVESIVRAAVLVLTGDTDRALSLLDDCGFQHDPPMERRRLAVRVLAGRPVSQELEAEIVADLTPWPNPARSRPPVPRSMNGVAVKCGASVSESEAEAICGRHLPAPVPGISAQVLALLASKVELGEEAIGTVRRIAADHAETLTQRREVISLAEASAMAGLAIDPDEG